MAVKTASAAYEIEATLDCALDYAKLLEKTGNSKKAISIIDYQIENSGADRLTIKQLKLFKRRLQAS